MTQQQIEAMIREYNISIMPDGRLRYQSATKISPAQVDALRAAKPEIIAHIQAREAARNATALAREALIRENVPGLDELREAIEHNFRQRDAFNRAMERGDGRLPTINTIDTDPIKQLFPRAAAYLKAEYAAAKSWDVESGAGRRAMERLIHGDDHTQVMADMDNEINAGIDWNN